ncbi:PhzF family phenazine biosynthesis protein [Xanthomonadaceae bacterium JHOS43]|nr:PhzF family phenazine biosynthesis protein [Xanthomonadaceae bacterium JHOS43]
MHCSRFLQLDVFPAGFGGGNPLGVVVDGRRFDTETMQRIARWTNLVETTFLLPPETERGSYRVRIFTPRKEIPFAGHPSVGSAHAALESGLCLPRDGLLWQECGAGTLPVRVEGEGSDRRLLVQAPAARIVASGMAAEARLAPLLGGHALGRLGGALVDGGRCWWLAELADSSTLRCWRPAHADIAALAAENGSMGLCLFAREGDGLAVRAFPAGAGIVEDPASGAANALIAAYIARSAPDDPLAQGYEVSQGREMGHDAHLSLRIDADGTIWTGGGCNTVIDGHLQWL